MNPNAHRRYSRVAFSGFLALLLPLLAAALACSIVPSGDQSLRQTDIAIGIQSTFLAQTATALAEPRTATPEPTSTLPISAPPPATDTATLPPDVPTEVPTATPTSVPEVIQLEKWTLSNMLLDNKCRDSGEALCWSGHGNDLRLVLQAPIMIESSWERPYLIFSQSYLFEAEASVTANVNGRWEILRTYPAGKLGWHDVAIDLSKYKGKEVTIQFYVGGQVIKPGGVWWKPDKQIQSKNEWSIQNIKLVPNYLP